MNLAEFGGTLDPDELSLAVHIHVVNRPLADAAAALGWTMFRVERTRRRLARKMQRARGVIAPSPRTMDETPPANSLPQYFERLDSGRRLWSMRPLSTGYLDLVLQAIPTVNEFSYVDENNRNVRTVQRVKARITGMETLTMTLERDLVTAKKNLARIQEQRVDSQRALSSAETKLAAAQAADKRAAEDEILENRAPDKKRGRDLDALRIQVMEAEGACEAFQRAIDRAQASIDTIQGELKAKELEILRVKFAPAAAKLDSMYAAMIDAGATIRATLTEVGAADLESVLFAMANPGAADWRAIRARNSKMGAFNAAISLLNLQQEGALQMYDRKVEAA